MEDAWIQDRTQVANPDPKRLPKEAVLKQTEFLYCSMLANTSPALSAQTAAWPQNCPAI